MSATAATPPGAERVAGVSRVLTASLDRAFPTGQRVGTSKGFQSPEFPRDAEADAAVTRSHSLRPSVTAALRAAATAAVTQRPPLVKGTAVSGTTPHQTGSFEGLNMFDQRFANNGNQFSVEPPDQGLCVGNGYILESVNDVLQVYTADGKPATPVTDLNTFYGYPAQFNRTTGEQGPFVTDPVCAFDVTTQRFFHIVLTLDVVAATGEFTGRNTLDIAVSKTSNPTGGWRIYRLPVQDDGTQGTPRHQGCPCIGDYPHVGLDSNALVLTTNEYPFDDSPGVFGNNFNGAQIYAFDKLAMARGANAIRGVQFENTFIRSGGGKVPGFTVWPAQSAGGDFDRRNNGTAHLLSSIAGEEAQPVAPTGYANQIATWRISNTGSLQSGRGAPFLSRALMGSQVYGVPPLVAQKVGPVPLRDCTVVDCLGVGAKDPNATEGPLNANDSRMQQTWYAGGKLMGALDTIVQVGGNIQAGIAWFVVDTGGATASEETLAGQGYLAVSGENVTYPAIATLSNGRGVMSYTLVGRHYFPSAAYSMFTATGGPGLVNIAARGRAPQDGFTEYPFWTGQFRPRWGDYGAAAVSNGKLYFANEYIAHSCTFAEYKRDTTCGGTRAALGNWSTRVTTLTP
ncbi:MAG TPA: hypothetical protein VFJ97_16650 [Dermatophilaceae bacterium]|nr:hypothetical protein [Dermatophilaceae bacterium]